MAYTNVWAATQPLGSQLANLIDDDFRGLKTDIVDRINTVLGTSASWDAVDPIIATKLNFGSTASPKILGGATDLHIRNNADNADNVVITDAGAATIRAGLTITTGGLTIHDANIVIDNGTSARLIIIDAAAGNKRALRFNTAGNIRWETQATNTAESGGNSGSDWVISRYNDAGAFIDNPFQIIRSDGSVNVFNTLIVSKVGAAVSAILELRSDTGQARNINFRTGVNERWQVNTDNGTESGSNAGSNFNINRYDDSGNFLDTPLFIIRSTGQITATSITASRFRLTAITNGSVPSVFDLFGSASGTPSTYVRMGGLYGDFGAGAPIKFGLFGDAVDLEFKSTNTSNTINLLNKVSLTTTGVASGTSILDINKDNGASLALYVKINRVGVTRTYLGLDASDNFVIVDNAGTTVRYTFTTLGQLTVNGATGTAPLILNRNDSAASNPLLVIARSGTNKVGIGLDSSDNLAFGNATLGTITMVVNPGASVVTVTGIYDTSIGFRIGGAAPSNHFLKGNGTNYVDSTIVAADLPTNLNNIQINGGGTVTKLLTGTVTFDPPSTASGAFSSTSVTVTGCAVGDPCFIDNQYANATFDGLGWQGIVSSANTVTLAWRNSAVGATDLPSKTIRVVTMTIS